MSQLSRGQNRRIMYIENKDGAIDGIAGRIGWVTFSKSGRTVYYQDKSLKRLKGGGMRGNFFDEDTGEEYWVSGIKLNGKDAHWAEPVKVVVDEDARDEYQKLLGPRTT